MMSAFDRVIGYEAIKTELKQVCDMTRNPEVYEKLGARMPRGILLDGAPGLGKTLLADCFIKECGLPAHVLRRMSGGDHFVDEITNVFDEAEKKEPAVVFLDDMDKFANEDDRHCDAKEYVAVQACIDRARDKQIIVIATVNNVHKLPDSLWRSGRFDRRIHIGKPSETDAEKVIRYYMKDKPIDPEIDMDDVTHMIGYESCAELEMFINEAAIRAAYERRDMISIEDLLHVVLHSEFGVDDDLTNRLEEDLRRLAYHEAGHLIVAETLQPGCVGLATINPNAGDGVNGFIHLHHRLVHEQDHITLSLAGKTAVEMYFAQDRGYEGDILKAADALRDMISCRAAGGLTYTDSTAMRNMRMSEALNARIDILVGENLEKYAMTAKNILIERRNLLEKAAEALVEKKTLLYSDIRKLKQEN